jgi:putative redox protein
MTNDGSKLIAGVTMDSAGGFAQTIHAGAHALTADEPASNGGTDTGPAPYALLLSAVGACTSITLRMYAQRKGWELGEIHMQLKMLRGADGAERIERTLRFAAPLTDEQRARLGEIADKTPVTKTVRAGVTIVTTIGAG